MEELKTNLMIIIILSQISFVIISIKVSETEKELSLKDNKIQSLKSCLQNIETGHEMDGWMNG